MRESIDGAVFLGGISVANGDDEQKDDFLLRGFVERSEDFLYQSVEEPVNVTVLMSCARTTNTEVGLTLASISSKLFIVAISLKMASNYSGKQDIPPLE